MMKFLLFTTFIACISCTSNFDKEMPDSELATIKNKNYLHEEIDPYDINFDVNLEESQLLIKIDLKRNSYYISPNSKGNFKGVLKVIIPNNEYITLKPGITDTPEPKETINPWGEGLVSYIKENTIHSKIYELKTESDFSVEGIVQFVIEPKCTMEKIPVTIFKKDGKLSFVRNCP